MANDANTEYYYAAVLQLLLDFNQPAIVRVQTAAATVQFVHDWRFTFVHMFQDEPFAPYFRKAVSNLDFDTHDGELYIRPQQGGSCTYMSIVIACLAVCMLHGPDGSNGNPAMFFQFFTDITILGNQTLHEYQPTRDDMKNYVSAPLVILRLIDDHILEPVNTFTQAADAPNTSFDYEHEDDNSTTTFVCCNDEQIEDFANAIRNGSKTTWSVTSHLRSGN